MTKKEDTLFDVLGNSSRRSILKILAQSPKYLLELSKEMDISIPAIEKHLSILEKNGIISSFEKKSNLGARPRKYYEIIDNVYLSSSITSSFVSLHSTELSKDLIRKIPAEFKPLQKKFNELKKDANTPEKLNKLSVILSEIDEKITNLEQDKSSLLSLRQEVQSMANHAMDGLSDSNLEKKMLYEIIGEKSPISAESISVEMDVRERTVLDLLDEIKDKGVSFRKNNKL